MLSIFRLSLNRGTKSLRMTNSTGGPSFLSNTDPRGLSKCNIPTNLLYNSTESLGLGLGAVLSIEFGANKRLTAASSKYVHRCTLSLGSYEPK